MEATPQPYNTSTQCNAFAVESLITTNAFSLMANAFDRICGKSNMVLLKLLTGQWHGLGKFTVTSIWFFYMKISLRKLFFRSKVFNKGKKLGQFAIQVIFFCQPSVPAFLVQLNMSGCCTSTKTNLCMCVCAALYSTQHTDWCISDGRLKLFITL